MDVPTDARRLPTLSRRTLLAAAVLSGCSVPPARPGSVPSATSAPSGAATSEPFTCTVMTWNVMTYGLGPDWYDPAMPREHHDWAVRAPVIERWLHRADADVIGFQEAQGVTDAQGRPANLMTGMLPGHGWALIDHWLPIAYRQSVFEMLDSGVVRIHESSAESPWERFCTWARLRHRPTRRELMVFNTHLQPFQTWTIAGIRSATVTRLIEVIREVNPGHRLPAVLTGDLNARDLDTRPVFVDTFSKLQGDGWRNSSVVTRRNSSEVPDVGTHTGFGAEAARRWRYRLIATRRKNYDYVFVRRGMRVLDYRVDTGPGVRRLRLPDGRQYWFFADAPVPSDHCPVRATVRIG